MSEFIKYNFPIEEKPGVKRNDYRSDIMGNGVAMYGVQEQLDGYVRQGLLDPIKLKSLPLGEIYNDAILSGKSGAKAIAKVVKPDYGRVGRLNPHFPLLILEETSSNRGM